VGRSGCLHRLGEIGINVVALLGELGDVAQRAGVRGSKLCGVDGVGPCLEGVGSFCSGLGHGVHLEV